ncbi:MAG: glycoside hydrolase family 99-like domain-containing protein [Bacteroidales bacterium]|nr:glycoside hydrolase family 99-like domain-containing protein [Prevotella sp.]MBR3414187.1 glycoside hydrolase family 99-like domain-containing protein [Bacteroidales bacterium]
MKARIIAYYLPQFHPIPENDDAWGKGFTEWTNVAQARPLFRGHYQPRIPADLGFYDLRLPETREQQAQMAREAGIEGFCYYHYWMGGGKQLLQRPFEEVLQSGKPDFPFCLAWANHEWTTRTWQNGGKVKMIAPMLYPGDDDYTAHFNYVLPALRDKRYITVDGNPIFSIYDPYRFADVAHFIELWRELADKAGLPGIHFSAMISSTTTVKRTVDGSRQRVIPNLESSAEVYNDILTLGFDSITSYGKSRAEMIYMGKYRRNISKLLHKYLPLPTLKYNYPKVVPHFFAPEDKWENVFPTILPQWDRTPRAGNNEGIYVNATPENFLKHIEDALQVIKEKQPEHQLLFLKSWNEWGEGNYVEPDQKYGHGYLNALQKALL